jgi:hypothetical protein
MATPKKSSVGTSIEDHIEHLIDESLEYTFPASDPPAIAVDTVVRQTRAVRDRRAKDPG